MRRAILASLLAGMLACADDDVDLPPADEPAAIAGDPCGSSAAFCVDEQDVIECIDRQWSVQSCADHCASLGPGVTSPGCDVELATGGATTQLCACEPPVDGCWPWQGQCADADTLLACADDWTWASSSCTDLCAAQSLLSLGCDAIGEHATCLCTTLGTPCTDEGPLCSTSAKLATCEGGVWVESDCGELCGHAAACDPGRTGPAACAC